MLVKNWMTKGVVSVDPDESMQRAISLMKEHKVRMLPVMKDGDIIGIVSDTDLKRASASDATMLDVHEMLYLLSKVKIKEIMSRKPITVPEDYTVEETAELLMNKKISGVPVVNQAGAVVGIITRDDLYKVLITLSGLGKRGIQLAFCVEDRPGSIKDITDVIRTYGGRIASILSSYERAPAGSRVVYIRMYEIDRGKIDDLLADLKQCAMMLYFVDHRTNKREILSDLGA
ncbi:MAG: CBS and ACT domain-containing protein [Syntrophobacteraceae bacterium]|nr:CBS and ACT domain-containing protein [Desulfobacteraceae bacterium]